MEPKIFCKQITHQEPVDVSIALLQSLGYRTERTVWDLGAGVPSVQQRVRSIYLISSYQQDLESFQIFHLDLVPSADEDVLKTVHITPVIKALTRRCSQGWAMFILSGGNSRMALIHPRTIKLTKGAPRFGFITRRLILSELDKLDEWLFNNLRLGTPEQTPCQLWERHHSVFEELRQRRLGSRRQHQPRIPLLDAYLEDLRDYRVPSRAYKDYLIQRLSQGEPDAKQELIRAHLWLVVHEAKRYRDRGLEVVDIIQQGNLGLLHAAEKFDPKQGTQFSSYAVWWIRRSILVGIARSSFSIRMPDHSFDGEYSKLFKLEKYLHHELGFLPPRIVLILMTEHFSDAERGEIYYCLFHDVPVDLDLKTKFKKVEKQVQALLRNSRGLVTLSLPIPPEISREPGMDQDEVEPTTELQDVIVSPQQLEEDAETRFLRRDLVKVLESLPKREREILEYRFGFKDGEKLTLQALAVQNQVHRETIRNIEARAIKRLKHPRFSRPLRDYLEGGYRLMGDDFLLGTTVNDAKETESSRECRISEKEKKAQRKLRQAHASELKRWQEMNRRELLREIRSRLEMEGGWSIGLTGWIQKCMIDQRTNELEGLDSLGDFVFSETEY